MDRQLSVKVALNSTLRCQSGLVACLCRLVRPGHMLQRVRLQDAFAAHRFKIRDFSNLWATSTWNESVSLLLRDPFPAIRGTICIFTQWQTIHLSNIYSTHTLIKYSHNYKNPFTLRVLSCIVQSRPNSLIRWNPLVSTHPTFQGAGKNRTCCF